MKPAEAPKRTPKPDPPAPHPQRRIALLTLYAVAINGYHFGVAESGVWIPAIRRIADPLLYPFNSDFFQAATGASVVPALFGTVAGIAHIRVEWLLFLCQIFGVFLLLAAARRIAAACFEHESARWGAVGLLALLICLPVAGTGLQIMETSFSPRTLSTPALAFAIGGLLERKRLRLILWWLAAALVDPLMAFYAAIFILCLFVVPRLWPVPKPVAIYGALLFSVPFVFDIEPARGAARDALLSQPQLFLSEWAWYNWLAAVAPLVIVWWFALMPPRGTTPAFNAVARSVLPFGVFCLAAAAAVGFYEKLQNYARLQPMRGFHLIFLLLTILVGGLAGEFARSRRRRGDRRSARARWLIPAIPAALIVLVLQRLAWPLSPHIELPGYRPANPWIAAFQWVRDETPKDAVFALDPDYLHAEEQDGHSFRAIAQRSAMADNVLDQRAAALYPQVADDWRFQNTSLRGWQSYDREDFQRLAGERPINWLLLHSPFPQGLNCPYQDKLIAVCRIEPPPPKTDTEKDK